MPKKALVQVAKTPRKYRPWTTRRIARSAPRLRNRSALRSEVVGQWRDGQDREVNNRVKSKGSRGQVSRAKGRRLMLMTMYCII